MQDHADTRFAPTPFAWVYGIAGLVVLGLTLSTLASVIARGDWGELALLVYPLAGGTWLLLGLRNRNRPVLEIRGREVEQGWILSPWRRSWRLDDVVDVRGPWALTGILRVQLRNGKTMRIPLREMRSSDRARAVELLRERTREARPS